MKHREQVITPDGKRGVVTSHGKTFAVINLPSGKNGRWRRRLLTSVPTCPMPADAPITDPVAQGELF